MLKSCFFSLAACACALSIAVPLSAETRRGKAVPAPEQLEQVDMFDGMKEGKIDVLLVPKDSTLATVVITNKGDKPLNIKLPATFAGVPVLAQMGMGMGMGGMGGGGMGGMGMGGMGGGGMGGMGMGGMGMGIGGTIMTSLAAGFVGSMVAQSFMDSMGGFDGVGEGGFDGGDAGADAGGADGAGADVGYGEDMGGDVGGDFGGDFGGGDFGGFDV